MAIIPADDVNVIGKLGEEIERTRGRGADCKREMAKVTWFWSIETQNVSEWLLPWM